MARESIGIWDGSYTTYFCSIDTSYEIFQDQAANSTLDSYLQIWNMKMWPKSTLSAAEQNALFPVTFTFQIGNQRLNAKFGKKVFGPTVFGAYESARNFVIPTNRNNQSSPGTAFEDLGFDITITVKANGKSPFTFRQRGHGTFQNTINNSSATLTQYGEFLFTFGRHTPASWDYLSTVYFQHWSSDEFVTEYACDSQNTYNEFIDVPGEESNATLIPILPAYTPQYLPGDEERKTAVYLETKYDFTIPDGSNYGWLNNVVISRCYKEVSYSGSSGQMSDKLNPEILSYSTSGEGTIVDSGGNEKFLQGVSEATVTIRPAGTFGTGINRVEFNTPAGRSVVYPSAETNYTASVTAVFPYDGTGTIRATIYSNIGTTTEATYTFPVIKYEPPKLTAFTVHRVSPDNSGAYVDSLPPYTRYAPDDQGAYCAIVTTSEFQSFAASGFSPTEENAATITIEAHNGEQDGTYSYTPPLSSYTFCHVVAANTERSFAIDAELEDAYYYDERGGVAGFGSVKYSRRVSTAGVIMDFANGGKSIGIGKVAEQTKTVEIASDWELRAYRIVLGDFQPYGPSGQPIPATVNKDMQYWFEEIEERLSRLEQQS